MRPNLSTGRWIGLGCHDTPEGLLRQFGRIASVYLQGFAGTRLLELFAGDGRLGLELMRNLGPRVRGTFVEVDPRRVGPSASRARFVVANAFAWQCRRQFDIVVANPPFLALTRARAAAFGFSWDTVSATPNLYQLGMLKCVDLVRPGGVLLFVAPFAWLRAPSARAFREEVLRRAEEMRVWPWIGRNAFRGASQDVAVIAMRRNRVSVSMGASKKLQPAPLAESVKASVGAFVWNRERSSLTSRAHAGAVRVVYGGCITAQHKLRFDFARYRKRKFACLKRVVTGATLRGPAILLRRTLRGGPGDWHIDWAPLSASSRVMPENHVIYVRCGSLTMSECSALGTALSARLEEVIQWYGSPNLSCRVVNEVLAELVSTVQGRSGKRGVGTRHENGVLNVTRSVSRSELSALREYRGKQIDLSATCRDDTGRIAAVGSVELQLEASAYGISR